MAAVEEAAQAVSQSPARGRGELAALALAQFTPVDTDPITAAGRR